MTALKIKENGEWKTVSHITGPKGKDGSTPNITYQVETLAAGSKATVTKSGTDDSPTLTFGIPRGANGSTPSVANYIPKTGSRGDISGYTSSNVISGLTVNQDTPDNSQVTGGTITVEPGTANTSWTKLVSITNTGVSISLGDSWIWSKGEVPTVSANCILICHWCNDLGIAYIVDGADYLRTYTGTVEVAEVSGIGSVVSVMRDGVEIYNISSNDGAQSLQIAIGDLFTTTLSTLRVTSSNGITGSNTQTNSFVVESVGDGYSIVFEAFGGYGDQ